MRQVLLQQKFQQGEPTQCGRHSLIKDETCSAARLKQMYRRRVRVPRKRRSICPRVCSNNKASLPTSPEMAPRRGSEESQPQPPSWEGEGEDTWSLLLQGKTSVCVLSICAPAKYPQWCRHSWHCVEPPPEEAGGNVASIRLSRQAVVTELV